MSISRWSAVLVLCAVACGDDGGGGGTTTTSIATEGEFTTNEITSSSTTDETEGSESGTSGEGSESGSSGGSGSSESSGGSSSTGGLVGDPSYPPVDGGACPGDQVPTQLPGGSICEPFCRGDGGRCPAAA